MEHKSFSLGEFKALEEPGTFDAIVAVFGNVDHGGDRIHQGAFKRTLSEWRAKGRGVPILWSHDSETVPIGIAPDLTEVKEGLRARGARLFIEDNPLARSVYAAMKGGALPEFSFGYGVPAGGASKTVERGRTIRNLKDLDLGEISPVFRGMNPATRLIGVKSFTDELESLKSERVELERKIAEVEAALTELPEETTPPEGEEHDDKPEPNPADITVGEEAMARIRALQASQPIHVIDVEPPEVETTS